MALMGAGWLMFFEAPVRPSVTLEKRVFSFKKDDRELSFLRDSRNISYESDDRNISFKE